jgi:dinuclear metal center YbgI/SA1388 family protein
MPALADVTAYLDALLDIGAYRDYGPNGLQVPGRAEVQTVVTGVSAHAELLRRAAAVDAQLVVVHHGLFWKGQPLEITPTLHRRLKVLYGHEMALAAYHLPLDAHPEHGNNALLAAALGGLDPQPFGESISAPNPPIGLRVRFADPGPTLTELVTRVRTAVGGREPLVVGDGPERIRTLGVITGAGADAAADAIDLGLDALLTGEPAERTFGVALDGGIHVLAAGHHATETFGVRRLGELLERRFGVRHVFLDVPNPI